VDIVLHLQYVCDHSLCNFVRLHDSLCSELEKKEKLVGRVGVPVVGFAVAQKECVIYPYKEGRCASLHM
jgi:hypothetical protein